MLTDKDRLFQILCIFMDNAIQHSKNNSLIEIEVIATEKKIAFSVADHGQGISDEDKQYIFDRFYSGDKSHTNKSNWTGTKYRQRINPNAERHNNYQ